MRRLFALILGICFGVAITYAAFNFHCVRTSKTWYLVPKKQISMELPYADIREWTVQDWHDHPHFVESLVADGHGDLVLNAARHGAIQEFFSRLRGSRGPDFGPGFGVFPKKSSEANPAP